MSRTRVAIIGAGVSGSAAAAALAHGGRMRGRRLDIRVYGGDKPAFPSPVLLTRECRARLAALGCGLPEGGRPVPGVEVIAANTSERFPAGPGGLWAVSRHALVRGLALAAANEGAHFSGRRAEAAERDDHPDGAWVVRSAGVSERFDALLLATGMSEGLWPRGDRGPQTIPAIEARLTPHAFCGSEFAKLLLAPVPGVTGLYLIPDDRAVHAVAFGPAVSEADLCQAVMVASRDGHLPMGFAVEDVRATRLAAGVGRSLLPSGALAVGAAAMGHPLQLGIAAPLASCSRITTALLEAGIRGASLRTQIRGAVRELAETAGDGARSFHWLLRAKGRAPAALARARAWDSPGCWGGVLGLPSPTPASLLRAARWAGLAEMAKGLFFAPDDPGADALPPPEPRLVYVVEDDDDVREALSYFLRSKGAEVIAFSDELTLFAAVAVRRPAAILLDVVLRRVDGLRLCEGLKRHPLSRDVRVLVTSGLDRPHVRARALAAGADAFLPKPLNPALLWAALATSGDPSAGLRSPRAFVESASHAS